MIKQLFEIGTADPVDPLGISYIRSIENRFEECVKKWVFPGRPPVGGGSGRAEAGPPSRDTPPGPV
ncbi:hypothetical protein [Actinocorallia sp. B10E7]|uniref:hypothetical protein n=1 Tax=Actinocorallia sp. B10E7 TaxID=3153558 RepID=UPI00325FCDA9